MDPIYLPPSQGTNWEFLTLGNSKLDYPEDDWGLPRLLTIVFTRTVYQPLDQDRFRSSGNRKALSSRKNLTFLMKVSLLDYLYLHVELQIHQLLLLSWRRKSSEYWKLFWCFTWSPKITCNNGFQNGRQWPPTVTSWSLPNRGAGEQKHGKGFRSTSQLLQSSHGDVGYSVRMIVNNTVITMYGVRWGIDLGWQMKGELGDRVKKVMELRNTNW